jgi:hypothetical protein
MAADTSINGTEAAAPPGDDKPAALREPSAPLRPPRPAKRASGSGRIPLPSAVTPGSKLNGAARDALAGLAEPPSSSAPSSAPVLVTSHAPSSAPAVATTDAPVALPVEEPGSGIPTPVPTARAVSTRPPPAIVTPAVLNDPATNYEFSLTRRSSAAPPLGFDSAAPPLSFDSIEIDPSDRAPAAPLTPWRDVPPLKSPAGLESLPSPEAGENPDHEDTIVGQVPKDLLDLSSEDEGAEENTRAYQAPQELIDLARREREERRQAQAGAGKRGPKAAFPDSLPPTPRHEADADPSDLRTATVPVAGGPSGAAAPAVELSRPVPSNDVRAGAARAKQPSLSDLARDIAARRFTESQLPGHDGPPESSISVSGYRTPWVTRRRVWALLVIAFIVVGYALARWRGMDLLQAR